MQSKKIIDLFCGCGGFSKGFEDAGFEVVLAIDNWNDAIETFNINHKRPVGVTKNIYDFTNDEIKMFANDNNVVGIIGGPPCQGFSMVGKREESDERNTLYLQYVRFVEQIKPEFFILENVKDKDRSAIAEIKQEKDSQNDKHYFDINSIGSRSSILSTIMCPKCLKLS